MKPALRSLKAISGFDEDSEWIVMMVRGKWEGAWGKGVIIFNINVKKKLMTNPGNIGKDGR